MKFQIADALVDFDANRIERAGGASDMEPRVADVLRFLVQHAGQVVSRDDLLLQVWNTPHVSDDAVTRCINLIRRSFGDDARQPRVLQTITKRGYRLIADVRQLDSPASDKPGAIIRTNVESGILSLSVAAFLIGAAAVRPRLEGFLAADMRTLSPEAAEREWRGRGVRITVRTIGADLILRVRRVLLTALLPIGGGLMGFVLGALSLTGPNTSLRYALAGAVFAALVGVALGLIYKARIDQRAAIDLMHRRDTIIAASLRE